MLGPGGQHMHVKWRRFAATVAIALLLWVVYTFRPISISVDNCQFFVTTIFDQAPLQYDFANRRSIQHFFSRWQRYARCSETYQEDAEPSCGPLACGAWNGTVQQYNSLLHDNKERKLIAELQGGDKACKSAKGKAKRRVLFLTSLHSFHTHMDRWFYHLFYDATIYSQWDVYIWGLGFPGYDANQSLEHNLRYNWALNPEFDVMFAMYTWLRPTNFSQQPSHLRLPGNPLFARVEHEIDVSVKQARQDLLDDARMRMIRFTAYTAYITGPIAKQFVPKHPDLFFRLAPHGVPSFVFDTPDDDLSPAVDCSVQGGAWVRSWSKSARSVDFFFAGHLQEDFYPLRQRLYELSIKSNGTMKHMFDYYSFPGYLDLAIQGSDAMECTMRHARVLPQYKAFMGAMRGARVCLVTRGDRRFGPKPVAHYAIRKYQEAMAAGCLLVGDKPDNPDIASHVAVVIDEHMDQATLAAALDKAVEDYNNGVYDDNIKRAYCAARTHYNYVNIIDKYMEPVFREADAHFGRD